jgi:lipopolysaccharide/colanic/teichoic acid biosynthesis glycosyltransferase
MVTLGADWQLSSWEADDLAEVAPYHARKRAIDIALASTASLLLLPLAAIVAVAVRLDSRGPVLYAQERVGLDRRRGNGPTPIRGNRRKRQGFGKPFTIYKFRSMVTDAERHTGAVWAQEKDPRCTRVGAFLRRSHLDEIPQLINVLRGEMSMIGPRPERPQLFGNLVAQIPQYALRCRTLPGITGIAQVKNGYDDSLQSAARKVQYDLYYIRRASPWMDLRILMGTALIFVRGKQHE